MGRHIVILAGGSGTRLWPRSREKSPKHLLALAGRLSLLQSTFERVRRLTEHVYVVTERSQVESIREQLPQLEDEHFVIGADGDAQMLAGQARRFCPGARGAASTVTR